MAMQYADLLTVAANHAGIPAISVPAGLDEAGLPLGVQIMGPDFAEQMLFRVGSAIEQDLPEPTGLKELLRD